MGVKRLVRLLAVAALLAPPAVAGDEGEWERPHDGLFPPEGEKARAAADFVATRVVLSKFWKRVSRDETGSEPDMAHTELCRFLHDMSPHAISYETPLACAKPNEDGVVWLPFDGRASHWVLRSPPLPPVYVPGLPERTTRLAWGARLRARVLDGFGRPVVGARVDLVPGVPSAPTLASATSDASGRFRIEGVPAGGTLWIAAEGHASTLSSMAEWTRLRRPPILVLPQGRAVAGRVVDADERPLAGVTVRRMPGTRGPAVATDAQGGFRLSGLDAEGWIEAHLPGVSSRPAWRGRVSDVGPVTLRIGEKEVPTAEVTVHVTAAEGPGPDRLSVLIFGEDGVARPELLSQRKRAGVWRLPPGTYRVRSADPFGAFDVAETFEAPREGTGEVTLRATRRPRLEIRRQGLETGEEAVLTIHGAQTTIRDGDARAVYLPATGQAVLSVDGRFFEVGPPSDGVRRVEIPAEEDVANDDDVPDATEFKTIERLPRGSARVWFHRPDGGTLRDVLLSTDDAAIVGATSPHAIQFPTAVVVKARGLPTLRGYALRGEDLLLEWGTCVLDLVPKDRDGRPIEATVLVDDDAFDTEGARVRVEGLKRGPHRVIVSPITWRKRAVEMRVVLAEGETRAKTVTLPDR